MRGEGMAGTTTGTSAPTCWGYPSRKGPDPLGVDGTCGLDGIWCSKGGTLDRIPPSLRIASLWRWNCALGGRRWATLDYWKGRK